MSDRSVCSPWVWDLRFSVRIHGRPCVLVRVSVCTSTYGSMCVRVFGLRPWGSCASVRPSPPRVLQNGDRHPDRRGELSARTPTPSPITLSPGSYTVGTSGVVRTAHVRTHRHPHVRPRSCVYTWESQAHTWVTNTYTCDPAATERTRGLHTFTRQAHLFTCTFLCTHVGRRGTCSRPVGPTRGPLVGGPSRTG